MAMINGPQFLQATMPTQIQQRYGQQQGYGQPQAAWQGVPNTTARIEPSFKPTTEDFERANAWIEKTGGNFFTEVTNTPRNSATYGVADAKATQTEYGFTALGNGNGELISDISGREDKIEGADFKEYFA